MSQTNRETDDELLRQIVERAKLAIWAASGKEHNYAIRLWSAGAEEIYGFSKSDAIGANYLDLVVDELERPQAIVDHDTTIETGRHYRNLALDHTRDGSTRVILTQGFPLWHPELKEHLQAEIGIDITEVQGQETDWLNRVRELALRQEEADARLRLISQLRDIAAAVTALSYERTGLDQMVAVLARSVAELADHKTATQVWYESPGKDLVLSKASEESAWDGQFADADLVNWCLRSRNSVFIDYKSHIPPSLSAAQHKRRWGRDVPPFPRSIEKSGPQPPLALLPLIFGEEPFGVLLVWIEPPFSFDRSFMEALNLLAVQAALGIANARFVRDLRSQSEVIAQVQERATRTRLSFDFAHRTRNLVEPILGNCQLLLEELREPVTAKTLRSAREMVADIARSSRDFLRTAQNTRRTNQATSFELNDTLQFLRNRVQAQHPGMVVSFRRATRSAPVRAIKEELVAAFENILYNSIEAVNGRGRVEIRATVSRPKSGPRVNIRIRDWGPGIPDAVAGQMWTGISTKGAGHGYGLPRSKEVFESLGGSISLEAAVEGTCMKICLPLADQRRNRTGVRSKGSVR